MPTLRSRAAATMTDVALPTGRRVALVHDWLTGMRGGEKCLEIFCEIFPEADLFTLLHLPGTTNRTIEARRIITSPLQRLPAADRIYRWALPLMPAAIESFDFSAYDLVLSSSHCVAKGARARSDALSICYCHTPMRYVWDRFDDYFASRPQPLRGLIGLAAAGLRRWDRRTAPRVGHWLANSTIVSRRIREYYGVAEEAVEIVPPPVDTACFRDGTKGAPPAGLEPGGYELVVSALVPYKRIDLAVLAAKRSGRTLLVVGKGPERARLQRLADEAPGTGRVVFAGPVPEAELPGCYAHCRSFLFPGLEDFGITPLEATASGRPVVAYRAGGALDTVREGINGIFFDEQRVDALAEALADPRLDEDWSREAMTAHAAYFDRDRFRQRITDRLAAAWLRHGGVAEHG